MPEGRPTTLPCGGADDPEGNKVSLWAVEGQLQAQSVLIVHEILIAESVYIAGITELPFYTQQHLHVSVMLHLVQALA